MLIRETVRLYGADSVKTEDLLRVLGIPEPYGIVDVMAGNTAGMPPEAQIKAEALAQLIRTPRAWEKPQRITSPRAAGDYLLPKTQGWTEERFGLLALNAKGDLLADRILSRGTATATMISPREFFREALRHGATTALAFHNHPSGDPTPSDEDRKLTRRLRTAGDSLGVPLSDHLVLGNNRYFSFRAAEGWDRES
jgi:DNA repair protein RadC